MMHARAECARGAAHALGEDEPSSANHAASDRRHTLMTSGADLSSSSSHALLSFSCIELARRRSRRLRKSTASSSWSWLKHVKTTRSLPVCGSRSRCRHCAHTSFIMHCIGEL